jgi:hypothetical protein
MAKNVWCPRVSSCTRNSASIFLYFYFTSAAIEKYVRQQCTIMKTVGARIVLMTIDHYIPRFVYFHFEKKQSKRLVSHNVKSFY